jgi:hypothetical protein
MTAPITTQGAIRRLELAVLARRLSMADASDVEHLIRLASLVCRLLEEKQLAEDAA